jgi:hypothetical protein
MTSIDTNVSNYTLSELMAIVELNDLDPSEITEKTNKQINRFKSKNPEISVFFQAIQSQLLQYADGLKDDDNGEDDNGEDDGDNGEDDASRKIVVEGFGNMSNEAIYPAGEKQISNWYQNENLEQSDTNQTNKITDRKQKVQTFGNQHAPMKREQLGVNDTYQVPVKQDSLNPNLKNTITRFINLDSQFRQYTNGVDTSSTDYTLDLSDTLKDALSLRVFSYQIPYSWYTIDVAYGNTCLWIRDVSNNVTNTFVVSVTPGNYNPSQFVIELTNAFNNAGFYDYPSGGPVSYNSNSGKITLNLFEANFGGNNIDNVYVSFTVSEATQIIFYDFTGVLQCTNVCLSKSNHYFNNSLGWIMGFRIPYTFVDPNGNIAPCILDLNGTKYIILVIDDYNQNHVNNGLVSITQFTSNLKTPSYYSPDIPYFCLTAEQQGNNLQQIVAEANLQSIFDTQNSNTTNGLLIGGKYDESYSSRQIVLPSAPRTLTQSQIYTINEINKNRNNTTNYLSKAPTSSDILGILPIKTVGLSTGSLIVEFSGSVQDNIRTYFGPVNIDRMCVKLIDDKGNILNLNGNDWCVTLICECLYQY